MKKTQYNRIKAVLADRNITNKELASMMKIGAVTVSRWCTNDQQPTLPTLYRIAKALDVDVRELLVPPKK